MDKNELEKLRSQRERRLFHNFEIRTMQEGEEDQKIVEGYAATFEQETVLFKIDGKEYKEIIARGAFDESDFSDVIFNYNHGGKVMARTRNKTLETSIDNTGLFMRANLSGTEEGRKTYEEIKGGYIDRMSFAFRIAEESFNQETLTWTIRKISKVYDVSAVDYPAYDTTSIAARRLAEVEDLASRKAVVDAELQKRKQRLRILLEI